MTKQLPQHSQLLYVSGFSYLPICVTVNNYSKLCSIVTCIIYIMFCPSFCSSLDNVQQSSPFFIQFSICKCHYTFSGSTGTFAKLVLWSSLVSLSCKIETRLLVLAIFYCKSLYIYSNWTEFCLEWFLNVCFRWYRHVHCCAQWNAGRLFLSRLSHWALRTIQLPLYHWRRWFTLFLLQYLICFTW